MSFEARLKKQEPEANSDLPKEIREEILKALSGLRFGSVEIVVHDQKVVQIERKEKVRFADRTTGGRN